MIIQDYKKQKKKQKLIPGIFGEFTLEPTFNLWI